MGNSGLPTIGSSVLPALVVALVLAAASVAVARRVATGDRYHALFRVMVLSAILHMACAPLQIFVVDHFYQGIADWLRYDQHGALLAANWRNGSFTTAGAGLTTIVGDGSVSIATGAVMTVVGINQLATFIVFAWFGFIGTTFFYRAMATTFPEADLRRYAALVFLFPSLLFWTANAGKEAIMLVALGLTSLGAARILARRPSGYAVMGLGMALGILVRPNELVLLVGAVAVAMLIRGRNPARRVNPARHLASLVFMVGAVVGTILETRRFLRPLRASGLSGVLLKVSANNKGAGAGFGSSLGYSPSLLRYPRDVYNVLLNPPLFAAHGVPKLLTASENTLILITFLFALPRLRFLARTARRRPYVMAALIYSAAYVYVFAALGNLGLIARERTLLLPLLLVLFAVPVAPRGSPLFPWQARARRPPRRAPGGESDWIADQKVEVAHSAAEARASVAADAAPGEASPVGLVSDGPTAVAEEWVVAASTAGE